MQKTEKHCKNQCFCYHKKDENQSENGSKNSKIRLRARPPAEPQKKMLQTKKLRSKSWKTRVFFTFRLPILDGRVHEQVSSVLFFTVFFEGERHDLSKTGGFGRKMPPPGKPVTFYECHPEDHTPAPSVRADFRYSFLLKNKIMEEVIKIWFVAGYSENFYMQNSFKSWNKSSNTYLNKHWNSICVGECLPMTLGNAS